MPGEKMQNGSEYMKDPGNRKCDEDECVTCGHPVTIYGYRDPEDAYNGSDVEGEDQIDDMSYRGYDSSYGGTYEGIHEDDDDYYHINQRHHKVRFDEKPHVINYEQTETDNYNDQNGNGDDGQIVSCGNTKTAEDVLEHMDGNSGASTGGIIGFVVCHIILLVLALIYARWRGHLNCANKEGTNASMILCIILFPQFYIMFALVEFLTQYQKCWIN